MPLRLPTLIAACLLSAPAIARAQPAQDYQTWVNLDFERSFETLSWMRVRLELDSRAFNSPRDEADNGSVLQNPSTVLNVRPQLGYKFGDWATTYLGYTYQPQLFWRAAREDIHEHRLHVQLGGDKQLGRFKPGYRTRLEQRYRATGDNAEYQNGEGDWAYRARQRVSVEVEPVRGAPWRIRVYDEVLFHLNHTEYPTEPGFGENRAYLGATHQTSETVTLVVGYMNQFARRIASSDAQLNHVLWVTVEVMLENLPAEQ